MLLYLTSLPIPNKILLPTAPGECGIFYYSSSQTHSFIDTISFSDTVEGIKKLSDSVSSSLSYSDSSTITLKIFPQDQISYNDYLSYTTSNEIEILDFLILDYSLQLIYQEQLAYSVSFYDELMSLLKCAFSDDVWFTVHVLPLYSLQDFLSVTDFLTSLKVNSVLVDGLSLFDSIFVKRILNLVDQLNLDYTFSASTGYLLSDVISFISEVVALQTGNAFFYDSVSLEDFVHLIAHYKESLQDAININHILQSLLIAITLDKSLNFNDYINEYIEFSLHSPLFLLSYGNASLKCSLSDMVDLSMLLDYRISSLFRDSVTVMDEVTAEASLFYSLIESLYFYDLLSFTSSALEKILALYIDLYYPQRFSFLDISAINCSDTIFALQDGLYTLDLSSTNSSMVALNFSELQSSRMKRIDKIYSNVPLYSATLYADDKKYFLSGNSKFISVPKGIRAKDYKLVIENTENVEFIDVALFEERRPK